MVKIEIFIAKNLQRFYSSSEHDNEEGDVELDEEVLLRSLEKDLGLMGGDLWPWRTQIREKAMAIGQVIDIDVDLVPRGWRLGRSST